MLPCCQVKSYDCKTEGHNKNAEFLQVALKALIWAKARKDTKILFFSSGYTYNCIMTW